MEKIQLVPVTRETFEAVDAYVRSNPGILGHEFATLAGFRPTTTSTIDGGIGFAQRPMIGDILSPQVVAGGNEEASYPTWGTDLFFVSDDVIEIGGEVKATDTTPKWTRVDLDVHGRASYVDPREARAAATTGINIVAQKSRIPEQQVAARREYLQAQFFQTTGSYASSSHYQTLAGTTQWSHASSTPIAEIIKEIEFVRGKLGQRPTHLWLGPNAFRALRFHSTITDLVKYTNTGGSPNIPASIATLAALFGINVVVGEAVVKTSVSQTGALADVWGDSAGLCYVGGAGLYDPKFSMTVVSNDYPKVVPFRDENRGGEGSDGIKFLDAYKIVSALNTAGYWWNDVTNF